MPTNAQLLVTGQLFNVPSLNGVPLEPNASGAYTLPELTPHTTYRVTWNEGVPSDQAISFTTGDGPSLDPAPEVNSSVEVTRNPAGADAGACALVPPQGCFDTGPPARVRFGAGLAPVAWIVESLSCEGITRKFLWPGECGVPLLEREDRIVCARLQPTDGVHIGSATPLICSEPELPSNVTLPRSSGCVGAWPPEDALTLTAKDDIACASTAQSCSGSVAAPAGPSTGTAPTDVRPASDEPSGCSTTGAAGSAHRGAAWLAAALWGLARARRRSG